MLMAKLNKFLPATNEMGKKNLGTMFFGYTFLYFFAILSQVVICHHLKGVTKMSIFQTVATFSAFCRISLVFTSRTCLWVSDKLTLAKKG